MTSNVIKRVVEIVKQLELVVDGATEDNSHTKAKISELCQIHDALVGGLQQKESSNQSQAKPPLDIVRFRLCSLHDKCNVRLDTAQVAVESDMYRAILGISMYLQQAITGYTSPGLDSTKEHFQRTIRQSTLLIKILSTIHSFSCGKYTDLAALPSQHPILERWIEGMEQRTSSRGEDASNTISFDRQDLALEEDQLLLMANTPIPSERRQDVTNYLDYNRMQEATSDPSTGLLARMSSNYLKSDASAQSPSVQISMDHLGLIRLRALSDIGWWAALTPASTTSYESATFTITSVVIPAGDNSSNSRFSLSTIALEVGRDGRQWWEATSTIIQKLNDLQLLQAEVEHLWPRDQVEIQVSQASNIYSCINLTD